MFRLKRQPWCFIHTALPVMKLQDNHGNNRIYTLKFVCCRVQD